jgi:amino acid permease
MLAMAGFSFMEMTGCMSAETRDARKSVPRAVFLTLLTVTAIYLVDLYFYCFGGAAYS